MAFFKIAEILSIEWGLIQKISKKCIFASNILQMLYKVQALMHSVRNKTPQKQNQCISSPNQAELALVSDKEHSLSHKNPPIKFFRFVNEKAKKIKRKPDSIMDILRIQAPFSFQHVTNFLNMLSINQRAIKDKTFEESYFRSIFYFKSIEKVQLRKNALILYLKHPNNYQPQSEKDKIQYLIERYKSFGDLEFYQLALQLQKCYRKYKSINFTDKLNNCFQSEPLSRFIELMQNKIYGCKVTPNKLIISRALLQLLGEDMQTFALSLCKYKTPMQEIISSQQYVPVITKSIESFSLLCDYLEETIDLQTLQDQTYLQFYDYLCSKSDKKIYCKLKLYMPTPLMNCLQAIEIKNEFHKCITNEQAEDEKRKMLIEKIQEIRFCQNESLRCLIPIQQNMLRENKDRVPGYIQKKRH